MYVYNLGKSRGKEQRQRATAKSNKAQRTKEQRTEKTAVLHPKKLDEKK